MEMTSSTPLRLTAFAFGIAGTLFWLYTFYGIAQVPEGDGSGFQWVAVMPLGAIFLLFTVPALHLARRGRALKLAVALGAIGLVLFALLWMQLMTELYPQNPA